MKKERNRMKKAQSRKREPFRIYRASITVEAALLYPILIFLLMFLLQKTITYYQQTDQAAQGNHICGRTRYIKDVLEDSFSTTGNGRNKRESGIAGG